MTLNYSWNVGTSAGHFGRKITSDWTTWHHIHLLPYKAQWLVYIPPRWTSKLDTLLAPYTYVLGIILTTKSYYFHIQYSQTVVSNGSILCSSWGMNYIFTYNLDSQVPSRLSWYHIFVGKRGCVTDFCPCASVFTCRHQTITAPHSPHETFNPLTPKDIYNGRTAPLTSKSCILYIYSTNAGTEYIKRGIDGPFFLSSKCILFHNSNVFGSCFIHILYTGCAKI